MKSFLKILCVIFLFLTVGCISVEKDALYTPETIFYILSNNPLNRITVRDDEIIKGIEEALKRHIDVNDVALRSENKIEGYLRKIWSCIFFQGSDFNIISTMKMLPLKNVLISI